MANRADLDADEAATSDDEGSLDTEQTDTPDAEADDDGADNATNDDSPGVHLDPVEDGEFDADDDSVTTAERDHTADVEDIDDAEPTSVDEELAAALDFDAKVKLASERPREWRRVRKWDREPDPHDWRYFVGMLGRIMLATGVLMFGFVAYQLWGTGIETARAQNSLEQQFEELVGESALAAADDSAPDDAADPDVAADAGTADDSDPTPDAAETAVDAGVAETGQDDAEPAAATDAAGADDPVIPAVPDLADQAVEQDIPDLERGDVLARLEIPRIDQDVFVVPGVKIDDLKDGPGHYPDTPLPGQLGNAAIAGHRTTYGSPFFDVDQLEPGDELIVTMVTGDRFVYEVTGTQIVEANDYWVVSTTNPNTAELTLTSCHPKYSARQRIVVTSVLNPDKSAQVGFPTSYQLDGGSDEPIPGDDPVLEADDTSAEEQRGDGSEPAAQDADEATGDTPEPTDDQQDADATAAPADAPTDDEPVDGATTGSGTFGDAVGVAAGDEFSRGWFDDSAAWPQIILWGLVLTLIALAAYRISRRVRRDLVGFTIGIVPFVVALYFFFQNVHRLLPPGI